MTRILGTSGNDAYGGAVADNDTAVIAARGVQSTFRASNGNWVVTSTQGSDTLTSIEQVELNDAIYSLTLPGTAFIANVGGSFATDIAALSNGNYVVTWSNGTNVLFQVFNDGNEAVSAVIVAGAGTQPSVTANATGGFALSYLSGEILVQQFNPDGTANGAVVQANTTIAGSQVAGDLTFLANGTSVVVWQDNSTTEATIRFQRFNAAGAPLGVETTVGFPNTADVSFPDVLALPNGSFVIAAQTGNQLYLRAFGASGGAAGGLVHVTQDIALINPNSNVSLFETTDGFGVAWQGSAGIALQLYDSARNPIGAEIVVPVAGVFLGMEQLASGQFAVIYRDAGAQSFVQMLNADGTLSGERTLLDAPANVTDIEISVLSDGGLGLTWQAGGAIGRLRTDADGDMALPTVVGDADPNHITAGTFTGTTFQAYGYTLSGLGGNDVLTGDTGRDRLIGGLGADRLIGGNGDDLYVADNFDTIVETETGGIDTVRVTSSYVLSANWVENVVLAGNAVADLTGNSLANQLTGNEQDNFLNGGLGPDRMIGRGGNDTYLVDDIGDLVEETLVGGVDTVVSVIDTYTLAANAEILQLEGPNALTGIGNALDNQIYGTDGANYLVGLGGADTLTGGSGNDIYEVDAFDQVVESVNGGIDDVYATGSWVLGDHVENLHLADPASLGSWNATGNALDNTIYGNSFANIIDGDEGADIMFGGNGNDTYVVDDAGDVANETFSSGNDVVLSSVSYTLGENIENLTLTGVASIDGAGNFSNNTIRANGGANRLDGGSGTDSLYGGAGNDRLVSQFGGDFLYGGIGDDTYELSSFAATDTIVELRNQGADTVIAIAHNSFSYTLGMNLENLVLDGVGGRGFGNTLDNQIDGNAGNNYLDGGAGNDTLRGFGGDDTYVVDSVGDTVAEAVSGGRDRVLSTLDFTLGANFEDLVLIGSSASSGTGNAFDNRIEGNSAANVLTGLNGDDILVGGGGNDTLDGGFGNDLLFSGAGSDDLNGRADIDTVSYRTIATGVTVNLALTGYQNTGAGGSDRLRAIENLDGSSVGGDTLTGNGLANLLRGFGGNDVLNGGAGDDDLRGMEGDDVLLADAGDDTLVGGNGIDTVDFRNIGTGVSVNLDIVARQLTAAGNDRFVGIENLLGTSVNDTFIGDYNANQLIGNGGGDILTGGAGNDLLDGGTGIDTASYASSYSGVIVDLVNSFAEDGLGGVDALVSIENIAGSEFEDVLIGNNGINRLTGDYGSDVLVGGGGNDIFVYLSAEDSGLTAETRDLIRDFQSGDLIDLSQIDADTATAGNDAFHTIVSPAATFTAAGQLQIIDGILYGNTDADAAAEFSIDLNGITSLTMADFIV